VLHALSHAMGGEDALQGGGREACSSRVRGLARRRLYRRNTGRNQKNPTPPAKHSQALAAALRIQLRT
jgi:hypothetical protein